MVRIDITENRGNRKTKQIRTEQNKRNKKTVEIMSTKGWLISQKSNTYCLFYDNERI